MPAPPFLKHSSVKTQFNKSNLLILALLVGLSLICLLIVGFFLFFPSIDNYLLRTKFDSAKWKSQIDIHNVEKPEKLRMVDDLMKNYLLVGMDRKQVEELLGVPPKSDYFSDYDYVYWLGPERGFISIDSEWLCIKLEDNIVVEVELLKD